MSNYFVPIKTAELQWLDNLPFSLQFNDIYFSHDGGLEQSQFVFIDGNHLISRLQSLPDSYPSQFNIGETGFGTGLNFLLLMQLWEIHAPETATLHFISCEKHPLNREDLIRALRLWPPLNKYAEWLIEAYPVLTPGHHQLSFLNGRIKLTLMLGDVVDCFEQLLLTGDTVLEKELRTGFIDAWFLDGFAPKKNKEMWSEPLIKVIALLSKPGTTLATYTAAQTVKSLLTQYGFQLKKSKGFGPKRHMISGVFVECTVKTTRARHTPWQVIKPRQIPEKSAVVIGGGLAGCFTAHALAQRGWQVNIIEEKSQLAQGASANPQAVLFPKLSAYRSPLTQFMLSSFLYAQQFYQRLLREHDLGELSGSFLLAHNKRENSAQQSLNEWLQIYPELGQLMTADSGFQKTGIPIAQSGLFIPLSGWINMPALCQFLVEHPNIKVITNTQVSQLQLIEDFWQVAGMETSTVVLCNGYQAGQFTQTKHLQLKPIRGQMTSISANSQTRGLKIPLCGDGHVLPAKDGQHYLGASYGLGSSELTLSIVDDEENLLKLNQLAPQLTWDSQEVIDHWVGVRAATTDYLPLVGPVAQEQPFTKRFKPLELNARRWIPESGIYYPGLFICAGFGSRGLTTIPLSAEFLAASINQEMNVLPRNLIQAISPARFLRKNITRGLG